MKLNRTFLPAAALLAAAAVFSTAAIAMNPAPAAPGSPAPAFTLPDTKGKSHNLNDFRGKFVVLEWFNDGCPFVKKHYVNGDMQATQKWAKEKGVVWLKIVSSAPGQQGHVDAEGGNKLIAEWKINSTAMLLDPEGTVGRKFGARTTPHMFVIDPQGTVIYNGAIDSNRSANPADVPGATNFVRQALTEALAGKPVSTPSTQPYGCSVKYAN